MSMEEYMELEEERLERTADAWDEMAEAFFKQHGWTDNHIAYDTDRGTGTLWVMIDAGNPAEHEPEVWRDTGISAKKADRLLTQGWDTAELIGYEAWLAERWEEEE